MKNIIGRIISDATAIREPLNKRQQRGVFGVFLPTFQRFPPIMGGKEIDQGFLKHLENWILCGRMKLKSQTCTQDKIKEWSQIKQDRFRVRELLYCP